jgi:hypothetical protein
VRDSVEVDQLDQVDQVDQVDHKWNLLLVDKKRNNLKAQVSGFCADRSQLRQDG